MYIAYNTGPSLLSMYRQRPERACKCKAPPGRSLKEQDVDKEKLSRAPVRDNMNVIRKWRKNTWLVLQV
jgi:hypothetical protein